MFQALLKFLEGISSTETEREDKVGEVHIALTSTENLKEIVEETRLLAKMLLELGGAPAIHGVFIKELSRHGDLSLALVRRSPVIALLLTEMTTAKNAVIEMKKVSPSTSESQFTELEEKIDSLRSAWEFLMRLSPDEETVSLSLTVHLKGPRKGITALWSQVNQALAPIQLRAILEDGKAHGAEFYIGSCGHLLSLVPGKELCHHDTLFADEELKAQCQALGVELKEDGEKIVFSRDKVVETLSRFFKSDRIAKG